MRESEELREALLNLNHANLREARERRISEGLLAGLEAIVLSDSPTSMFQRLFESMRGVLEFEFAFVLTRGTDNSLNVEAASDPLFAGTLWKPGALFQRVLSGRPVSVYDVREVDEWKSQSPEVLEKTRSALLFPFHFPQRQAMFVCAHSRRGFFSMDHLHLARRFSMLAAQAMQRLEAETQVANLKQRLEAEEKIATLQRQLIESERKFSLAFRSSPIAIAIVSLPDFRFIEANDSFLKMVGYSRDRILGFTEGEIRLWATAEERDRFGIKFRKERSVQAYESEFKTQTGERRMGLLFGEKIELEGQPCLLALIEDITERKQVEEDLKSSLNEKTVLLREVHHRVKNNMQIISSLLNLQSNRIQDQAMRDIFRDSQNRIHTMAIVHERLYQSQNFNRIEFKPYIQGLADSLFRSYNTRQDRIQLEIKADDIYLDLNHAIPLGMIVNELISNSLKHAFPDGAPGRIHLEFNLDSSDQLRLVIRDDGIGMPKNSEKTSEGFGMEMVHTLAAQLDGRLVFSSDGGTTVDLIFPRSS
jgi:PAS domain S-box-containing protein